MDQSNSQSIPEREYVQLLQANSSTLQHLSLQLTAASAQCRRGSGKQALLNRLQTLIEKIELELEQYQDSMRKCRTRMMKRGSIAQLRAYFTNNFNSLNREAHQLLNFGQNRVKEPSEENFRRMRAYQSEICEDWDRTLSDPQQTAIDTEPIDKRNLSQLASSHLQKEFLAIRMIAYRMYEEYTGHSHSELYQEMKAMQDEQAKLSKQIGQARLARDQLLAQQKKLEIQLTQLKKINELVGRRYFIDESRMATNYSTG